jgi:hypothetical protein
MLQANYFLQVAHAEDDAEHVAQEEEEELPAVEGCFSAFSFLLYSSLLYSVV